MQKLELLRTYLNKAGRDLSSDQEEQFGLYYDLLVSENENMNLTAITELADVQEKHFLDSVWLGNLTDLSGKYSLADVGTGAGFPGIPLKIMYPELEVVLIDSLGKRVDFLNRVIGRLMLTNIKAVHMRAEDAGRDASLREQFDICVSRAVAELRVLSEYCLPLV
ncbi:MAG: 16S rRNA (guanine(527)-N(7))-methyltransferase RsmG, partial [Lachnospiraceae bacterium]|nr:16S rRNA (guanine(527)-N(7))-methyltransferase RsmG [Lachnospiraceae bacterium]